MNFHQKPITFVAQVNIKVQDLQRSLAFYKEVIGFKVLSKTDRTAELTADGKTALLRIEQPENAEPKMGRTTGLYHFALLLPKRSDLAKIVRHFVEIGLQFGSSDHLVSEALYLSDPDGNGIEIYIDRSPSDWTWKNGEVMMTVDPLDFPDLISIGQQQSWKGLPAGTVMGHIHLHVAELANTEKFYTEGLGFEAVCRYGTQALFISSGKYHHHIGLNTWNGVGAPQPSENSVGLQSFKLIFENEAAINQAVENLKKLGAAAAVENNKVITEDPSGNRIILGV
ncbi:VOC family protein [Cytobacillus firmus]|uniref:Glyoxalase family protein n=1 Tax=Cytobacillus firmus TaxID=1399 RepID=A0A7Y5EQ13_CYTFI|nr:VOC family protein [Cytobacillus firmus]KAF0823138.1 Glyoxalase family protein [Cytobacillus firmus]MBG9550398.1 glyoxalase [Cytobacillus firmus]MBG9604144.1 glyoxalase [Cytobacillus firmus]MBG9653930.1 glyoxalase [Cytobacillus firmus]MDD9311677.1 VOC family protein [Cytobacillus firmus]